MLDSPHIMTISTSVHVCLVLAVKKKKKKKDQLSKYRGQHMMIDVSLGNPPVQVWDCITHPERKYLVIYAAIWTEKKIKIEEKY